MKPVGFRKVAVILEPVAAENEIEVFEASDPTPATAPEAPLNVVTGVVFWLATVMMPDELTVMFAQLYVPDATPEFVSAKVVLPFETVDVILPEPRSVKAVPEKPLTLTDVAYPVL